MGRLEGENVLEISGVGPHEHADIAHHSSKLPLKIGPILSVSVVKRPLLSEAIYPYEFWGTDFTDYFGLLISRIMIGV